MSLPNPFQWALLLVLLAEGPERTLQAELVNDDLSSLADIARVAWPELLGRTATLQLRVDKVNLPENLLGLELPEVLAATNGSDWSALDLGACYRKARARQRAQDGASAPKWKAYASHQDVRVAPEVAKPLMTLRGFPGSGQHELPFELAQVLQIWKLYGREGSVTSLREHISQEGILTILRRFGQIRPAFVASKNLRRRGPARRFR